MDRMHSVILLLLARAASPIDLTPLSKLRAVSLARPPESRLIAGKLDDSHVAIWTWIEATMGDGAGAACTGVERALAERVKAATGGEAIVLSTCARLDVYSYSDVEDLAAIVASDIGGAATKWRAARLFAPRYERPVEPTLASRCGADAARHVFEVACFAGLERCEFDPFDSHQAHVVKQIKPPSTTPLKTTGCVGRGCRRCCGWRSRRGRRRATGNRSAQLTRSGGRPSTPWRSRRRDRRWRPPSRTKCSSPPS